MNKFKLALLGNPLYWIIALVIHMGFLAPALISAPSTFLVLVGVAIYALLIWWFYKMFIFNVKVNP